MAAALFAQGYPLPSKTPNTDVTCTVTECNNKKTVGYSLPLSTFVGRFLDSHATNDYQGPFRTGRSGKISLSPDGRRLYLFVGSSVVAYDTANFFTRLAAGEALMPSSQMPNLPYPRPGYQGTPEVFLRPERFFFAEAAGAGWTTPYVDGQARLNDFDIDDQGYVYLSHYVFGWGIVKDDLRTDGTPTLMTSSYQNIDTDTYHIVTFKNASGHYYALMSTGTAAVWDVTNRSGPTKVANYPSLNFLQGAKNTAGDRIAVADGSTGAVAIYTADALASNGAPIATFRPPPASQYASVTSDGTNFYATFNTPNLKVAVFAPNAAGTSYSQVTTFDTGYNDYSGQIAANDGYLTIVTTYTVLVYKINSDLGFTELPLRSSWFTANGSKCGSPTACALDSYFNQYYFNVPVAGYAAPSKIHATQAMVVKSGGNTYLLFSGFGLADVYQLQTGDSIALSSTGMAGTANTNTPVSERTKTFYGDPIGFTATTTAPAGMNIAWNFGNPEAVVDPLDSTTPNTLNGTTGPTVVKHRYTGIASSSGLNARTVSATNINDSGIFASTTVSMLPPVPRIGLAGLTSLITQSAAATVPIVAGDKWIDASDGSLQGHKSKWSLYAGVSTPTGTPTVTTLTPDQPEDVGQCGANYISFVGAYGDGTYTVPAGGLGVSYTVQPFAANITMSAGATAVTFSNATKLSGNTTALPPAAISALTYKWALLDASGNVVTTPTSCSGSPFTGDGPTGLLSAITPWAVPKCAITQRGMKVRLTVSSPTPLCGGVTSSQFTSAPLNPPDPVILGAGSCTGSPCTFTVASSSSIDQVADGWTYQWGVTGPATATYSSNTGSAFTVTFPSGGTYAIQLTVTNNVGTSQATPVNATVSVSQCGQMVTTGALQNVSMNYSGSNCSTNTGGACTSGSPVSFGAQDTHAFGGYNFNCAPHTFSWSFGDGQTGSGQNVVHTYSGATTYSATLTITNSSNGQSVNMSQSVTVGSATPVCGTMVAGNNVNVGYFTNSQSCSQNSGTCYQNESITFQAVGSYNYGCGQHSFLWSFGDGGSGSGQVVSHAYANPNQTYHVSLTIVGPTSTATPTSDVRVGGPNPNTGGGGCGTMVATAGAQQNVSMTYSGTGCSTNTGGGTCTLSDAVSFSAQDTHSFGGYNFACALHTFAWSFGDGTTGSGQTTSHTYSTANTYTVSLTITNTSSQQQVVMTQQVKAGNAVTCSAPRTGDVYVDFAGHDSGCTQTTNGGVPCALNENVLFTMKFSNYPASCVTAQSWNFGDGTATSSAASVNHAFATAKTHTVTLNVTVNGQVVPVTQSVIVKGPQQTPIQSWDFAVQPLSFGGVVVANAYVFMASSVPATNPDGTPAVSTWNWNFGDGVSVSQSNPITTHTFTDAQPHTVTLTIPGVEGRVQKVVSTPRRRSASH